MIDLLGYWSDDVAPLAAAAQQEIRLCTHPSLQADWVVCFNVNDELRISGALDAIPPERAILFCWEPPNVLHKMYKPEVTHHFSRIYTWNDDLVDGVRYFKFYYPVLRPMIEAIVPFQEKKLCTLVARHLSCKRDNSLYREREATIRFFEQIGERGFEFYGQGWDAAKWPSYRGPIDDKIDTIRKYRFSICYENSRDLPGYVTEKIFDCFAAGNVPIYLGASNIERYVPTNCFIDRRTFASLKELHRFICDMDEATYNGYLTRIRAYLESPAAQVFSERHFAKTFARALQSGCPDSP